MGQDGFALYATTVEQVGAELGQVTVCDAR
jgi:hypothetical protein